VGLQYAIHNIDAFVVYSAGETQAVGVFAKAKCDALIGISGEIGDFAEAI
jgi:hypothetical protein